MSIKKEILTGASSISAINFVAPLYYDVLQGNQKIHCFVNDSVITSRRDVSCFSESSRGSLPTPFIIRTARKSVTQGFLPFFDLNVKSMMKDSYQRKDFFYKKLVFWFDFHINLVPSNYGELRERIEYNKKRILGKVKKNLSFLQEDINVSDFSLLLIKTFIENLSPKTKDYYNYGTLEKYIEKISIEEVNFHIFFSIKNFLTERKKRQYALPFKGSLKIKYENKKFEFSKVSISKNIITLYGNPKVIHKLKYQNSKLVLIINNQYFNKKFKLKCTGSLSAELIARISKTIVTPWYLPVKYDSFENEHYETCDVKYLEYISPLKASSLDRRSYDVGGKNHCLSPSGYILMDYDQKIIKQWISCLLKIGTIDSVLYNTLKRISYLNFSSWNHTSNLYSRANTIAKVFLKEKREILNSKRLKPFFENTHNFISGKKSLSSQNLIDFMELISLFNYLHSSLFNKNIAANNFYQTPNIIKLTNLAINILSLISFIDSHIEFISFKKNSILEYLIDEKKLGIARDLFPSENELNKSSIIDGLKELSKSLELNITDLQKESLKVTRSLLNFYNSYFIGLIVYWNVFNVYGLKASLPNLSLLLTEDEFSQSLNLIIKQREKRKSLKFISSWKTSH